MDSVTMHAGHDRCGHAGPGGMYVTCRKGPTQVLYRERAHEMTSGTNPRNVGQSVLKPDRPVGIVGYGAYVPRYRLPGKEVARVWTGGLGGSPIQEKAVAGLDEDVITMSIEAAQNALARAGIDAREIRAVWVGSESHPYAVKPSSTVVAESIGAAPNVQAADWEFACKAGSEAMQAGIGFVGSGMGRYVLAMCWRLAWTLRRAAPATRSNTQRRRAARRSFWARATRAWPPSRAAILMLQTRRISGGGRMKCTPATATASPASQHTLPTC